MTNLALGTRALQHGNDHPLVPERVIVRGSGSAVWDSEGREILDAHAGAWLTQIGHGRPEMADAAARQILEIEHFTTRRNLATPPALALAERLVAITGLTGGRVRYSCSGSEADDDALRIVREYQRRRGLPQKHTVLTVRGCFHGDSSGGRGLNGHNEGSDVIQLSMPDPYAGGDRARIVDDAVMELEGVIAARGAGSIAAMFGEPVFGPAGMFAPPADYWPRMVEVLHRNNILFVADEVVTGFGRAGAMMACPARGIDADVIVLAKGIASGYAPISAVVMSLVIAEVTEGADGGGSYAGHALSAALALENIAIIEREQLAANAQRQGDHFLELAAQRIARLPMVAAVHGAGLMLGVRLKCDAVDERGMPLDEVILENEGVLLMSSGRFLVVTPPLIFTAAETERTVLAIERVLSGL